MTLLVKRDHLKTVSKVSGALYINDYPLADRIIYPQLIDQNVFNTLNIILCDVAVLETPPDCFKAHPEFNEVYTDPQKREHELTAFTLAGCKDVFFLLVSDLVVSTNLKEWVNTVVELHQLGIIEIKDIVKISTQNRGILVNQYLKRYSDAYADVNLYSTRTHKFKNLLKLKSYIIALKAEGDQRGKCDNRIWIDQDTMLLPLTQTVSVCVLDESLLIRSFGEDHQRVKRHCNFLLEDDGITVMECQPFYRDGQILPHDILFNSLQRDLLKEMIGITVDDGVKISFNFFYPTRGDAEELYLRNHIRTASFRLVLENDSYCIAPLANYSSTDIELAMYENNSNKGEYTIMVGGKVTQEVMKKIVTDFYKHADWDVEVRNTSICGGGYNATGLEIQKAAMIFKDEDIEKGLIILGDKKYTA